MKIGMWMGVTSYWNMSPSGPPSKPTLTGRSAHELIYSGQSLTLSATTTDTSLDAMKWIATPVGGGSEIELASDVSSPYSIGYSVGLSTGSYTLVARAVSGSFTTDSDSVIVYALPDLLAWYDPDATYITKNGSNIISSWTKRAGSGSSAWDLTVPGAAPPTWSSTGGRNGGPSIIYSGTVGGCLKSSAVAISQPITVVHCVYPDDFAAGRQISDGLTGDTRDMFQINTSGALQIYAGTTNTSTATMTAAAWNTIAGIFNGATSNSRVNGTNHVANAGTGASSGISLGAYASGSFPFKGKLSHTVILNSAPDATTLSVLDAFMLAA